MFTTNDVHHEVVPEVVQVCKWLAQFYVKYPLEGGWKWNCIREEGYRNETITRVAKELSADLIVTTTDGPDRFLNGLRGTPSERVLRKAHCPVAVIPVESVVE